MIEDVMWCDVKKAIVLMDEADYFNKKRLHLYNYPQKRTEFSKHVDTQGKDENDIVDYAYVSSPDGKYLIGHRIENLNDMDATKPGTTRVYFYNIQTRKKTWVAFLMKHTKLPGKNQNLIDYYESPFILQHVAEMVGK